MIPFLRNLLFDETAFQRMGRAALAAVGQLMVSGVIPTGVSGGGKVMGGLLTILPFLIGAGPTTAEKK